MSDARARGWGNPDSPGYRQNHIVGVTTGGVTVYIRREIAGLVRGFLSEIVQRGYRLDQRADDWGYNNRDIRGRPGVKSNHAWGLAIDINSATNPMTEDGRVHTDMPAWIREVAHRWGFFWGADYSGARRDPMHFEFLGTPADVSKYPLGGQPATPEEEIDMLFIQVPGTAPTDPTYLVGAKVWQVIDTASWAALKKKFGDPIPQSAAQLAEYRK